MVCINANSAMNPVFQGNGKLCINVLNHEQEIMARHFAGMTGVTMEERFALSGWQQGALGQPVLKGSLASLEGEISRCKPLVPTGVSGGDPQYYPESARARPDLL